MASRKAKAEVSAYGIMIGQINVEGVCRIMKHIMVCVTGQKTCQRLIDYGSKMKENTDDKLFVIHVAPENYRFLGHDQEGEALEFLYQKARDAGAELTVERSGDVMATLVRLVDKHEIDQVIVGESGEIDGNLSFLGRLQKNLGGRAYLTVVPKESV